PLRKFMKAIGRGKEKIVDKYITILGNLYLLTNPLVDKKEECQIEDLFDQTVLDHKINGKTISRETTDNAKHYEKYKYSEYIIENFEEIDFKKFIPMLNNLNEIVKNYK